MRKNILLKTVFVGIFVSLGLVSNSCAKNSLSETAAFGKISSLPEVQLFVEKINHVGGIIKPIIRQESGDSSNNNLFEYYIGESHQTHDVLWNRFAIDKKTSEIHIFDVVSGGYVPLEEWRGQQK